MIAIVDYGVGNLFSLSSSLRALGAETEVTRDAGRLRSADKIILPGVGAFGDAREKLDGTGLTPVLREEAARKPLLGICLGMQEDKTLKVPHMGWNSLEIARDDPLFKYFRDSEYVYYVHSFYARDCGNSTLGVSRYGNIAVTGAVRNGNVWGTQFHPEKSGDAGLRLLRAFAEL